MSEPRRWLASERALRVTGDDAQRFLHDLLSGSIEALDDGNSTETLMLAPNGRLRAVALAGRIDGEYWLLSAQAENLAADLRRFRIRVDVEIEPDDRSVWVISNTGSLRPGEAGVWLQHPRIPDRWYLVGEVPDSLEDVPIADATEIEADRLELGEPKFGVDVDEQTIPNEAFPLRSFIDFDKGCYLGQELVERIDARGRVVKRLTGVSFATPTPPPPRSEVVVGTDVVGHVTSAARLSEGAAALAVIRSEVGPGSVVQVRWDGGGAEGTISEPTLLTNS